MKKKARCVCVNKLRGGSHPVARPQRLTDFYTFEYKVHLCSREPRKCSGQRLLKVKSTKEVKKKGGGVVKEEKKKESVSYVGLVKGSGAAQQTPIRGI